MIPLFAPRLFVSYARDDGDVANGLAKELRQKGFRVFLDTGSIHPGENFVARLSNELSAATGVVALLSRDYAASRWAQAELYYAVATRKVIIPILLPPASVADLDEPLERLVRDTQHMVASPHGQGTSAPTLGEMLQRARRRYLRRLLARFAMFSLPILLLAAVAWWAVSTLDTAEARARRERVLSQVTDASSVFPAPRIRGLAAELGADPHGLGQLRLIADDRAQTDVARFNALALAGELLEGYEPARWYVDTLDLEGVEIQGRSILNTSFLGGGWQNVRLSDVTFAGVAWSGERGFSMSGSVFDRVQFHGAQMDAVKAVDVTFVNSKFRGSEVDVTSFTKVRFLTESPITEGNPIVTPDFALFERSTLISHHTPPTPGVLDLTKPGDDVLFEGVMFVDCRLEGWFDPTWFRDSTFERCVLPPSMDRDALGRGGNIIADP